jgi:hypothetical protein
MPNPNRPQYQETIEETWGQAVADTVVRRYANTADRDADLAGFTPAELMGQLVVIAPGAGVIPHLEEHNGAVWHSASPTSDADGNGVILKAAPPTWFTSDGIGYVTVPFAVPFPVTCLGVLASPVGDAGGGVWEWNPNDAASSATHFAIMPTAKDPPHGGQANTQFNFSWIAWGH